MCVRSVIVHYLLLRLKTAGDTKTEVQVTQLGSATHSLRVTRCLPVSDGSALTRFDTIGHHSATSRHHKLQAALPGARMHDACVEQLLGHLGDKMRKTMQNSPKHSETIGNVLFDTHVACCDFIFHIL